MNDETCFFIPIPGSYRVRTGRCDGGTPPTVAPPLTLSSHYQITGPAVPSSYVRSLVGDSPIG